MRSLLFQGQSTLREPANCGPGRQEVETAVTHQGRTYRMILRDKTVELDPYLVLVKAAAFAVKTGEPYMGRPVTRDVRRIYTRNSTSS
jgi:hypothetical protein